MAIANQTKTVVGVFTSVPDAQAAVSELEAAGIPRDDISLVANKHATGYDSARSDDTRTDKTSDVVADAGIGAAIGGVSGLLLSAAGALTLPVIGPILAAGPIAAALTGAGIGAAAGGLIGALTEAGIPEQDAKYYAEGVRRGDVLVTVKSDPASADRACDIMDRHNAVDVNERVSNWRERGWGGYDSSAQPLSETELRQERNYYDPTWRNASDRMAESSERGLHRTEEAAERTGHRIKEGVNDAGRSVRRGATRVYDRLT